MRCRVRAVAERDTVLADGHRGGGDRLGLRWRGCARGCREKSACELGTHRFSGPLLARDVAIDDRAEHRERYAAGGDDGIVEIAQIEA